MSRKIWYKFFIPSNVIVRLLLPFIKEKLQERSNEGAAFLSILTPLVSAYDLKIP